MTTSNETKVIDINSLNKKSHWDGWNNILSGLKIKGKDKTKSAQIHHSLMGQSEAELIFAGDDMAEKINDLLPNDMMREGFTLKHNEDENETLQADMEKYLENLDYNAKVIQAMSWARLYGGSGILMGINDGRKENEPVDMENISSIDWMTVLHRWELYPRDIQKDPRKPNFRMPETYQIAGIAEGNSGSDIHHTRILRFDGAKLPENIFIMNNYWGDSIFSKLKTVLADWDTSYSTIATIISEYAIPIFKMKNLAHLLAEGKDELVQKRMDLVNATKSVVRAVILNDGEEFSRETPQLQNLAELTDKIDNRLASASKYPATILFGQGPKGGMGAKGDSEKSDYFERVGSEQKRVMLKPYKQFFKYAFNAKNGPTEGKEPEVWTMTFDPLKKETQAEIMINRKAQAEIDAMYMDRSVYDPDEVAKSRFGSGDFSFETQLDLDTRDNQKNIETEEFTKE